ncbi:carbohydrate ABC transporter substrate-binding protein (CUT1 family) [Zhihengliuella halotolerans]|uniref:Carbohydrate ABC transporter substrate-binding protein (CUT1 family) n=2 Tax=Zhihengliuella halotolerans TaxID=370736 RepID=A0A4Q8A924_9MICC|nr:carbohydrate ABC transporter substrate-binding protein (CUT1 family) [Zhihengliuella halotolerans]
MKAFTLVLYITRAARGICGRQGTSIEKGTPMTVQIRSGATRRAFTLSAVGASAAIALAACGGGSTEPAASSAPADGGASATITMWTDAERSPALKEIADKFEADKGIKVDLVVKDFAAVRDDFITQAPSGKGPDVLVAPHDWLGTLVQNGVVAPIQLGDKSAEFAESSVQAMTYDGQVYGVPYAIENVALVRNAELVGETHESFDDVVAAGQSVVDAGDAEYAFLLGLDPKQADPYHAYPLQTSFGAPVFEQGDDGSYDVSQLGMNNDGGQEFAQFLADNGDKGTRVFNSNITGDIAKEKFLAGESPYFLTGPWNVPAIEEAGIDFSVDALPSAGGEAAQPFVGVNGFLVSSYTKNELAANEFVVNYLSTEAAQDALFDQGGRPPALLASFEKAADDEVIKAFGEIGAEGVPMPAAPEMQAVWADWGATELSLIKGNESDPAAAWTKMSENIEAKFNG